MTRAAEMTDGNATTVDDVVTVYGRVSVTIRAVTGVGVIDTSTTDAIATEPVPITNAAVTATATVRLVSTPTGCRARAQRRTKQALSVRQRIPTRSTTDGSYGLLVAP